MSQDDIVIDAETGEIIEADDAWERHRRIVALRNVAEETFLALGEDLYWFQKKRQWKQMGYQSFAAYIADPDVDLDQGVVSKLIQVYERFCLMLTVSHGKLLPPGYKKLYMLRPYMTAANVEEWVATASTLSRSDLKLRLKAAFGKEPPPFPPGKYRVIYADPPWQYRNTGFDAAAEKQYTTLSTPEICEYEDKNHRKVKDLATDGSVLFLWVTNPMVPDGLEVIEAWGFEYKTNFCWVKERLIGSMAFYAFGQHELLMVATRGSALPKVDSLHSTALDTPRRRHSEKPKEMYDIIETMYDGPHLELFARNAREGWESWGDEIEG